MSLSGFDYEGDGIVSGEIRDFTRRYGMMKPASIEGEDSNGFVDELGDLWVPNETGSVEAIIFGGLHRVERPVLPDVTDQPPEPTLP